MGIVVIAMKGKDCSLPAGWSSISLLACEMSHRGCVRHFIQGACVGPH